MFEVMENRYNPLVDEYILTKPTEIASIMQTLRKFVLSMHPSIVETMKYNMPTYVLGKNIFHFAANKNHLGVYPTPDPIVTFQDDLKEFKTSKGTIQFPYNKEIPYNLLYKIIQFQINKYDCTSIL